MTRTVLTGCALAMIVAAVAGCGGPSKPSAADATVQREANVYEIDQIEQNWHKATSTHNLNLMMSLWAPGAVFNIDQKTLTGKAQIRHWFATENAAFQPQNHWESDTPSYKIRVTINGDKGTLYFECHYIDIDTGKVASAVGADQQVQKLKGKWLITNMAASSVTLTP